MLAYKHCLRIGFVVLTTSFQTVHAGLFDDDEARKSLIELRKEVRETKAAQDEKNTALLKQLEEGLNAQSAQAAAAADAAKRTQLDLSLIINQIRDDQAKLRGQFEVLSNDIANLQKRNRELEASLDARIKKLEPRAMTMDGTEALVDRTEEAAFTLALNQFKASDYKAASAAFNAFTAQFPKSGLLASAYFWLGNSQYANRDPKAALTSLQTMLQKSPDHPRAADAHLTMGHCYNEIGDKKSALKTFTFVAETYPNTSAAEAAAQQLPKPVDKTKKK